MKKLGYIVIAALLITAGWWLFAEDETQRQEDASLIFDRAWVDSLPGKDKRKFMHAFIVAKRLPFGVQQRASRYRLEVERFSYKKVKAGELALVFPQSGKKAAVAYQIEACDELPGHDLCLTLEKSPWGGPTRYYSKRSRHRGRLYQSLERLLSRTDQ